MIYQKRTGVNLSVFFVFKVTRIDSNTIKIERRDRMHWSGLAPKK
jgi:hypothetical protein